MRRIGIMKQDLVGRDLNEWLEKAPGLDVSGRQIIWRIQIASRYVEQAYGYMEDPNGHISPSGAKLLIYLSTLPAPHQTTPKGVGERLNLTSGTVTSLIDRLEKFGYVERLPDPSDRRGVLVRLTPEGLATAHRLHDAYRRFEADFLAPLDESERETLANLLRKLLLAYEDRQADQESDNR